MLLNKVKLECELTEMRVPFPSENPSLSSEHFLQPCPLLSHLEKVLDEGSSAHQLQWGWGHNIYLGSFVQKGLCLALWWKAWGLGGQG